MRSIRWKRSGSWQVRVDAGQDTDRINKLYKRNKPSSVSARINFVNPVYAVTLLKLESSNIIVLQIAGRGADQESAVTAERYP